MADSGRRPVMAFDGPGRIFGSGDAALQAWFRRGIFSKLAPGCGRVQGLSLGFFRFTSFLGKSSLEATRSPSSSLSILFAPYLPSLAS